MTEALNVKVFGDGNLYRAPLGTAKPANTQATLDAAYESLGFFNADGVVMSFSDNVQKHYGWQRSQLVRTARTETDTMVAFTPLETNRTVLETFHNGSTVAVNGSEWEMAIKAPTSVRYSWVFDAFDGTDHKRYYIPIGEITERGDLMYKNGDPVGYPMTMSFYPDSNDTLTYLQTNIAAVGAGVV